MNAKELEENLNAIDDHFQFQIEEYDKDMIKGETTGEGIMVTSASAGEIDIHVKTSNMDNFDMNMLTLLPPNDDYNFWRVDTDGNISQWDADSLRMYIKVLKIVEDFVNANNSKDQVDKPTG